MVKALKKQLKDVDDAKKSIKIYGFLEIVSIGQLLLFCGF